MSEVSKPRSPNTPHRLVPLSLEIFVRSSSNFFSLGGSSLNSLQEGLAKPLLPNPLTVYADANLRDCPH